MKYLTFLSVLSFICCNAFGSYIADLNPPEWRGLEGSTTQSWSFLTDDPAPIADQYTNPYGTPCVYDEIDGEWYYLNYIPDTWDAESIEFYIPIDESADATCYRIQAIWNPSATTKFELDFYVKDAEGNIYQTTMIDENYAQRGAYSSFEITVPNTGDYSILYFESSTMGMTSPTLFDEIVIDTISVPEPMSLSLLVLGGFFLKYRKSELKL